MQCIAARVNAIIVWRKKEDVDAKYKEPKCEQWEVVMPELVFGKCEPPGGTTAKGS